MCTISIRANIYSHVKNKFIFVPGKWRRVHAGNNSGDLSISSVAHSLMYMTAKYKLCGENLPPYGASRGINMCDHNS